MDIKQTKHELQNIISGKSSNSHDAFIQAVAHYLRNGKRASAVAEAKHENKTKETEKLITFAQKHDLFIDDIDENNFISSGAEQKVYIKNNESVLKLNDAIYYASWEDYFHNLLLNNYFFSDTAYQLIGFTLLNTVLHAVVQQRFVKADTPTNLENVKDFLEANGFKNKKNHDYYHPQLGIILEDLHDENVLTKDGLLYFIDTVFYIDSNVFWLK